METASLVILLIVLVLGIVWLAIPFVRGRDASVSHEADKRQDMVNTYARVVAALRDLEEDHTTGKLNDEAYEAEKARLSAQGVALLEALDKEGWLPAAQQEVQMQTLHETAGGNGSAADQALDEALEAAIARYASAKAKG
ncbi:MAG: hypothetical protein U0452_05775 [Anaerolineae bacterium]